MNKELKNITWLTEAEFNGKSFNGYSLMATLEQLSLEEVLSTDSYENFCVWGIVLHVMFCKQLIIKHMGVDIKKFYPYQEKDWPDLPESKDEKSWQETLQNLKNIHEAYIKALKDFPAEKWSEKFPLWNVPWNNLIYWYPTHDTFHAAQIRNMGIKKYK